MIFKVPPFQHAPFNDSVILCFYKPNVLCRWNTAVLFFGFDALYISFACITYRHRLLNGGNSPNFICYNPKHLILKVINFNMEKTESPVGKIYGYTGQLVLFPFFFFSSYLYIISLVRIKRLAILSFYLVIYTHTIFIYT